MRTSLGFDKHNRAYDKATAGLFIYKGQNDSPSFRCNIPIYFLEWGS